MNYMEQVAKMFGVKLGEEFMIGSNRCARYKFENDGLYCTRDGKTLWINAPFTLCNLLEGKEIIADKTYIPKDGQKYYTLEFLSELIKNENFSDNRFISADCFYGSDKGILRAALGLCFRTREEAEAALPSIKAKVARVLNGGKWEEEDK